MSDILFVLFSAVIVSNVVFSYGIGCENADESSSKLASTLKYGVLFILSAAVSMALKCVARAFVIERFALEYLKTPLYILSVVISVLVIRFLAGLVLPKIYGNWKMGDGLVTDFALVAIPFIFDTQWADVLCAVFAAVGVVLASLIFVLIKERLVFANMPKCMRGLPIMLVSAGIIALVFAELERVVLHFYL